MGKNNKGISTPTLGAAIGIIGVGGGGGGGDITDVQVNGVSVVSGGVANVPYAGTNVAGAVVIAPGASGGINVNPNNGRISTFAAVLSELKAGADFYKPIVPANQHESVYFALAKAAGADMASLASATVGIYPEAQKSAISQMLNGSVTVTGSTPSITALPGIRYVCGECTTLDITLPASGCFDVVFESGSTPTVLTATGVTWPAWFDPTALEANRTYEINIADGFGAVMSWA